MTPSSAAALHPGHRAARTPTLTATPSSPAPSLQTTPPPNPQPQRESTRPNDCEGKTPTVGIQSKFLSSPGLPDACTHACTQRKMDFQAHGKLFLQKKQTNPPDPPVSMLRHGRDADRASPGQVGWKGPGQVSPVPQVSLTCHSCSDKLGLPLSDAVGCNCEICPATHSCPSSKLLPVRAHNQGIWSTLDDGIKH